MKLVVLVALAGLVASETPTASQRANLKLAHDNYVTNTKASIAVAEPLYKKAVVDFNKTLGAGHFFTKSAKKRYNELLVHDSSKPAAEQALVGKTPYAASELSTSTTTYQGRCASALPTSATYTAQSKRTVNADMAGSVVLVTCADGLEATPEGDHVVAFLRCDWNANTNLYGWVAHGTCDPPPVGKTITSGTCCGTDRYRWLSPYVNQGRHICRTVAADQNLEPTFEQCQEHAVKTNGPGTTVNRAHTDGYAGMCTFLHNRQWYYNEANTPQPCSEDQPCFCQSPV
jgi:hypothetical protein